MKAKGSLVSALAVLILAPPPSGADPAGSTIETYAGGQMLDGRPGLENHIRRIDGVAQGPDGRVYFAETGFQNMGNLRVRAWDPESDLVHTVAGSGTGVSAESPHDGAPATSIGVAAVSVALDQAGDMFLLETGLAYRLRRVDGQTGRISTLHEAFYFPPEAALEIDRNGGVLFGTTSTIERWDPVTKTVTRIAGGGTTGVNMLDDQPATASQIGLPTDIETDEAGNIYFSESTRIRWIDTQGILHSIAGGRAGISKENDLYGMLTQISSGKHLLLARPDGTVWYTDGNLVRSISAQAEYPQFAGTRRVRTVVTVNGGFGDGPLTQAGIGTIEDWEGTPGGGFVFSDGANLRVRVVSASGAVTTVVGNGLSTTFNDPGPDTYDWTGDGGPATTASVLAPCDVAIAPDGDALFSEREAHHKVRRVDAQTGIISTVVGADGQGFDGDDGPATEALLASPCGVEVAPDGDVYVADTANHRVRKVEAGTGVITTIAGNGQDANTGDGGPATQAAMRFPLMLALDPSGRLYVSDPAAHVVRAIDPDGTIRRIAGTGQAGYSGDPGLATGSQLDSPRGLALMTDGSLLVADSNNNLIRVVTPGGQMTRVAGTGDEGPEGDDGPWLDAAFDSPNGLDFDPATGTIFVADTLNQVVRRLDPDGIVRRLAGTGELAYCGDGGPARDACLRNPQGIALTPGGDLLIADLSSLRIRRVRDAFATTAAADVWARQSPKAKGSASWGVIPG